MSVLFKFNNKSGPCAGINLFFVCKFFALNFKILKIDFLIFFTKNFHLKYFWVHAITLMSPHGKKIYLSLERAAK
jgi:hypothetical protein